MCPAAKAMVETLARAYGEGGRFLVVKWTAGLEFPAGLLELGAAADNLDDICSCDQIIDKILRD